MGFGGGGGRINDRREQRAESGLLAIWNPYQITFHRLLRRVNFNQRLERRLAERGEQLVHRIIQLAESYHSHSTKPSYLLLFSVKKTDGGDLPYAVQQSQLHFSCILLSRPRTTGKIPQLPGSSSPPDTIFYLLYKSDPNNIQGG